MGFGEGDPANSLRPGKTPSISGKTEGHVYHFSYNGWGSPHCVKYPEVEEHVPIPRSEESIGPGRDIFSNVSNHGSEPGGLDSGCDLSLGIGTLDINTLAHCKREEV